MKDDNSKKSKFSWSKKLVRKWFNIKCKSEEIQADGAVYGGRKEKKSALINFYLDVIMTNLFTFTVIFLLQDLRFTRHFLVVIRNGGVASLKENLPQSRKVEQKNQGRIWSVPFPVHVPVPGRGESLCVDVECGRKIAQQQYELGRLAALSPPVDIYVLGFQEIVPLSAGNILGAEDNGPAKKWLALIKRTLNNAPGTSGGSACYTPSPVPDPVAEWNADFEGSTRQNASAFFHRRSFQTPQYCWNMENDASISQRRLDRRFSVCDRVIFGHRRSDFDPNMRWGYRPSDCSSSQRPSDYSSTRRPSDYSSGPRPSDYSSSRRPSNYSWGQRPSDFSRWGSDEDFLPDDSPSTVLHSPMSYSAYAPADNAYAAPGNPRYSLVASKQMVGIFLTVWVRSELTEQVRNIKVSCVGRGLMGYLGNKGSISISMLLHQTSLCFVCSHLTSGQKEGDELRRNADVMEILRKTRFPRVNSTTKNPQRPSLNMTLPYRSAKALVEMQNWRALLEKDQLRIEQRRGRVFDGWREGKIYFPPTYKYSHNSDRYTGDDMHPKEKRRTPAWCDRILWHGGGLQQLSYVRGESRFSDHRPVSSVFWAEIESVPDRLRKSTSCSSSRIEVEELLPYSHGYTELCFF
ncbi:UNVERIFIED_CONTAM: Type IV inositol polyphosphate 5-phosphatase 7 [Sesamum latifolium]|uniref:Type IV inositol polyphosphate 5-phosphatase 7 n=1 Tax=Sesamum latifolium TaxID=2727402 RepID=A0AAW2VYM8_9LAMI